MPRLRRSFALPKTFAPPKDFRPEGFRPSKRLSPQPINLLGSWILNPVFLTSSKKIVWAAAELCIDFYCLTDRSQYSRAF
jgi:hypothetical protein